MDLVPEEDFCAPTDLTENIDVIVRCITITDESTCDQGCKWRRGKQAPATIPTVPATNNDLDVTGPFFSKNFCHPSAIQGSTSSDLSECLDMKTSTTCDTLPRCTWSTAEDIIPPTDFCAPADMTDAITVIEGCTEIEEQSQCLALCKWYKGTGDFSNYANTTVPAGNGTVTPPTDNTTEPVDGPKDCMPAKFSDVRDTTIRRECENSLTESDCLDTVKAGRCVWFGDLLELTPSALYNKEFCHPEQLGTAAEMENCLTFTNAADCSTDTTCVYGNLADSLPTSAFCGPSISYPYVDVIPQCAAHDVETACATEQVCQWYENDNTLPLDQQDHCALKAIYETAAASSGT